MGDFDYNYPDQPDQPSAHNYAAHVNTVANIVEKPLYWYFLYKQTFDLNNKLHNHIRSKCKPIAAITHNA
jgi:hypothetical protein